MRNNRLASYQQEAAAVVSELDDFMNEVHDDGRELTEADNAHIKELEDRIASVEKKIELEQRIENRQKGIPTGSKVANNDKNANKPQGWNNFGEFIGAVVRAGSGNHRVDPRLVEVAGGTGQNESDPALGGFLVQQEFANDLLSMTFDTGVLSKRVRKRQIGPSANRFKGIRVKETSRVTGSRYGGIRGYWLDEGGLKTASTVTMEPFELSLHKLAALCYLTDELMQDSVALEQYIKDAFREEFAFLIDDAIFRGTGAGQPMGIVNSPALISVAKESSQSAASIILANILNMYARFWTRSKTNGKGAWYVNSDAMPQLFQLTLGGTSTVAGVPVFIPPNTGISGSPYAQMMGLPIIEIEHAPTMGSVGDINLWDLDQYMMIEKGGIQTASSIHVRFIYDEQVLRFVYRCDGQPLWRTALTPYQGTNTQSPFVSLAVRP